ncbi:MAG: phosphohistidine phosphatase SixA [Anaerolineaceae bacterium]|nr:phosphohistidine phosphatase SixA [Anaerolineaceae bacterium]
MKILLMRHAEAMDRNPKKFPDDQLRPITKTGQKKTEEAARALAKMEQRVYLVLSSPLTRTQQTANIMRKGLHLSKERLALTDFLAPLGDLDALIEQMRKMDPFSTLLLVGHEPELGELISILLSGDRTLHIEIKKGSICCLTTDELTAGKCATLEWLLTPGQLSRLYQ